MSTRLLKRLRRLRSDQSGQSLVIMSVVMTMVLGVAALGIDAGTWDVKHHQDQVIADSAALAAANCLANPNTGPDTASTPQCTSSTDTTDAKQVAVAYAQQNGLATLTASNVNISNGTVTVDAQSTSASYFARLFGIGSAHESAVASASVTPGTSGGCAAPGLNCYAIFTKDTSNSGTGFTVTGGGVTITGGVHSNCNLYLDAGGESLGPTTYGSGQGCTEGGNGGGNSFTSGPTAQAASTVWPIDYSTYFPACTGAACTGPNGTPSYCTYSAANYTFSSSSQLGTGIYCAYGTGTAGTPSTWNGAISFTGGGLTSSNASFIGGTVSQSGGGNSFTAYNYTSGASRNNPLFYATSSSTTAVNLTGGGSSYIGDMFVPNGGETMTGGGTTTTFIEAQDVSWVGGGARGDGPSDTGGASTTTGTDSLTG